MPKKKPPVPPDSPTKIEKNKETRYIKEEILNRAGGFILVKEKMFVNLQSSSSVMVNYIVYMDQEDDETVGLFRDTHQGVFHSSSMEKLVDFLTSLKAMTEEASKTEPRKDADD